MQTTHYQAVFSDIDGTLLNNQHQITPKTAAAIQRIAQQNIPFILVSARPPLAITPYSQQLQANQPIICYSGALILDRNLTPLYSISINETDLIQLDLQLQSFQHLSINYYANTLWFSNDVDNYWTKQEGEITGLQAVKKAEKLTNVHKILVMGEADEILRLETLLKSLFPQLSIHRSKAEYLEIMNSKATKSKAIRFMQQKLGITSEHIVAFGDNFNDLDMLQYVGFGVAMANAPDEIKAAASYVTASNNEDGIALVLNKLFP
ncbi:Cof-type HAD-IIB family hydrolase [Actinobacillus suis]|uniref:HAD superfamily hydrolase n=3 Tax=Actinobacillus TaxID=713 RepID=K0GE51_ACTSU|nr:Cof-type HAD-IIB family hydrolase [Actinobacillus suis]AFU19990.1 HAD superfamily hydrolase [Actinobacillus suis H91-0380]AIJ32129.1 HAD superfamily hydrolase [Actinobacillus suis ATCC 33415]MCO4169348.1 Cof-type HAD-IIB family hydrolase [Actinobacillus suis]MCQ9630097.1 Cof-type HAD-IIB family hydrolase [Actinobacillus suis]MCQ9632430.1 Cof-type HAD-IIB family hydrolase [Actinobacillus suis]